MRIASGMIGVLTGLLALGSAVGGAESAGVDLVVSGIVPSATEPSKILVIVRNIGERPSGRDVGVELKLDDQPIGQQRIGQTLEPRMPLHVEFARPAEFSPGLHSLTAVIDPADEIQELSERNNTAEITIWVRGAGEEEETDKQSREGG